MKGPGAARLRMVDGRKPCAMIQAWIGGNGALKVAMSEYSRRTKTTPVVCRECSLEFDAVVYELSRGGGKFCSRICQRTFQARCNAALMKGDLTQAEMNARSRAATPPEVKVAHHAVEWAIERGELTRQPCEVCGATRVDAHHDDYSRPLDVRWLCRGHHLQIHRTKAS